MENVSWKIMPYIWTQFKFHLNFSALKKISSLKQKIIIFMNNLVHCSELKIWLYFLPSYYCEKMRWGRDWLANRLTYNVNDILLLHFNDFTYNSCILYNIAIANHVLSTLNNE